jgi:carboxyl-terminal processing protease
MTIRFPASRFLALAVALLALVSLPATARPDRKFTTPPTLVTEAQYLIQLLEQAHYNRDAVSPADYIQVIPSYMSDLDGQRLFFLNSDKAAFTEKYSKNLYWNIRELGNIDAAYDIFSIYEANAQKRINWILNELKGDFDLTKNESYRVDRSKSEWPANAAAADTLWRQRLKLELIAELMNKKTVDQAKETVRKRYERMLKNLEEIEGADLAELFLSNAARLYDPHSTYFSKETFEDFGIQMKLQLVGIGALLGLEEDNCFVKEIVPGGPVDLGKQIRPGDKIISVAQRHGEPVEIIGMKLRKIVAMIRGDKGTQVRLVIQPADATDPSARKEVVITRDVVKLNSARAHAAIFQAPGPDGTTIPVGVISLPAFYGPADGDEPDAEKTSATKDVSRLLDQLKAANIKGLVLDLRHNGGGFLSEAIDLTGLFIKRGPVVQVKNYAGDIQVDSDTNDQVAYDGPLAVLVDRFSASASEIVTGALQNYGRAIVIGDSSTHGKGSVQTIVEMKNLAPALARSSAKTGAAKITVQKYYLPNGSSTQLKGVVPDIVLPSIDDFLPIGESDLPHALVWDEIPTSFFGGQPLEEKTLKPLREASATRQSKLDEFIFLRKNVDWFKSRQSQKLVALNLEERRKQKEADDTFRKQIKAEKERLAKDDFPFREFRLGPPPPPKIKAPKKSDAADGDSSDDDSELSTDENESYGKVDVHLRESLRVVSDAVVLGQNRQYWASDHAPLTLLTDRKG